MFETLKDLFDTLVPRPDAADDTPPLQLACAALLVEVMRSERDVTPAARASVLAALRQQFGLDDAALQRLVALAERAVAGASDLFGFTSTVDEAWDTGQKIAIVEAMWRVAYADGVLGDHEQHLLWRIADLLHVPHGAYVHAKRRAREAAGA
ncbi:MAG: TerB family tellurite resistance protein [Rubrivivax sp.]